MAHISQEKKKALAPKVKAVLKKYGVKGTLATDNRSTLILNVKSGKIDFLNSYDQYVLDRAKEQGFPSPSKETHIDVNVYHVERTYVGKAKDFLVEVLEVLNEGNHNRSRIEEDYFDVGWYVAIHIGKWNKPYVLLTE